SAGLTVNGALGALRYKGGGQHNPTNTVVVDQIKGGKFVKVLKSTPTKVPAPERRRRRRTSSGPAQGPERSWRSEGSPRATGRSWPCGTCLCGSARGRSSRFSARTAPARR